MDTAMSLILLALSPFLFANRPTVVLPPRGPRHAREVVRYAQPLHITSGGTYSGNWESLTPSVAAVWITTSEPVVIENCRIRSAGDAIQSYNANANVTVRNCVAEAISPSTSEARKGYFVGVGNFESIVVEHNLVSGYFQGVKASNTLETCDTMHNQTVTVRYNVIRNVDGRLSDGNGGFLTTRPPDFISRNGGADAFALYCVRDAEVEISWNQVTNEVGASWPEDLTSTAESRGLSDQPIAIHDNYLQGDIPPDPAAGAPFSGCGIQIGDSPSKSDVGYVHVYNNQIVGFFSCGLSISSGHDNEVDGNRVISAGRLPEGTALNTPYKVGLLMNDYYWDPTFENMPILDPYWFGNTVHDNEANAVFPDSSPAPNVFIHLGGTVAAFGNTDPLGHPATTADEAAELARWLVKLETAGVSLGPNVRP